MLNSRDVYNFPLYSDWKLSLCSAQWLDFKPPYPSLAIMFTHVLLWGRRFLPLLQYNYMTLLVSYCTILLPTNRYRTYLMDMLSPYLPHPDSVINLQSDGTCSNSKAQCKVRRRGLFMQQGNPASMGIKLWNSLGCLFSLSFCASLWTFL